MFLRSSNGGVYQDQNGPNPSAPWHVPSMSSICEGPSLTQSERKGRGVTDLFGGVCAEHDRVFCADENLVFYTHAEAMKVFGELWISRDINTCAQHHQTGLGNRKKISIFAYRVR